MALVIRNVESGAFEYQTGATANQSLYFAMASRAFRYGFRGDILKFFKLMTAFFTTIFIRRHNQLPPR